MMQVPHEDHVNPSSLGLRRNVPQHVLEAPTASGTSTNVASLANHAHEGTLGTTYGRSLFFGDEPPEGYGAYAPMLPMCARIVTPKITPPGQSFIPPWLRSSGDDRGDTLNNLSFLKLCSRASAQCAAYSLRPNASAAFTSLWFLRRDPDSHLKRLPLDVLSLIGQYVGDQMDRRDEEAEMLHERQCEREYRWIHDDLSDEDYGQDYEPYVDPYAYDFEDRSPLCIGRSVYYPVPKLTKVPGSTHNRRLRARVLSDAEESQLVRRDREPNKKPPLYLEIQVGLHAGVYRRDDDFRMPSHVRLRGTRVTVLAHFDHFPMPGPIDPTVTPLLPPDVGMLGSGNSKGDGPGPIFITGKYRQMAQDTSIAVRSAIAACGGVMAMRFHDPFGFRFISVFNSEQVEFINTRMVMSFGFHEGVYTPRFDNQIMQFLDRIEVSPAWAARVYGPTLPHILHGVPIWLLTPTVPLSVDAFTVGLRLAQAWFIVMTLQEEEWTPAVMGKIGAVGSLVSMVDLAVTLTATAYKHPWRVLAVMLLRSFCIAPPVHSLDYAGTDFGARDTGMPGDHRVFSIRGALECTAVEELLHRLPVIGSGISMRTIQLESRRDGTLNWFSYAFHTITSFKRWWSGLTTHMVHNFSMMLTLYLSTIIGPDVIAAYNARILQALEAFQQPALPMPPKRDPRGKGKAHADDEDLDSCPVCEGRHHVRDCNVPLMDKKTKKFRSVIFSAIAAGILDVPDGKCINCGNPDHVINYCPEKLTRGLREKLYEAGHSRDTNSKSNGPTADGKRQPRDFDPSDMGFDSDDATETATPKRGKFGDRDPGTSARLKCKRCGCKGNICRAVGCLGNNPAGDCHCGLVEAYLKACAEYLVRGTPIDEGLLANFDRKLSDLPSAGAPTGAGPSGPSGEPPSGPGGSGPLLIGGPAPVPPPPPPLLPGHMPRPVGREFCVDIARRPPSGLRFAWLAVSSLPWTRAAVTASIGVGAVWLFRRSRPLGTLAAGVTVGLLPSLRPTITLRPQPRVVLGALQDRSNDEWSPLFDAWEGRDMVKLTCVAVTDPVSTEGRPYHLTFLAARFPEELAVWRTERRNYREWSGLIPVVSHLIVHRTLTDSLLGKVELMSDCSSEKQFLERSMTLYDRAAFSNVFKERYGLDEAHASTLIGDTLSYLWYRYLYLRMHNALTGERGVMSYKKPLFDFLPGAPRAGTHLALVGPAAGAIYGATVDGLRNLRSVTTPVPCRAMGQLTSLKVRVQQRQEAKPYAKPWRWFLFGALPPRYQQSDYISMAYGTLHRMGGQLPAPIQYYVDIMGVYADLHIKHFYPVVPGAEDHLTIEEFINSCNWPRRQKTRVLQMWYEFHYLDPDAAVKRIAGFMKGEWYPNNSKPPRGIQDCEDMDKCVIGAASKAEADVTYLNPCFVKHVPVDQRADYIVRHLDLDGVCLETDYVSMEACHRLWIAVQFKLRKKLHMLWNHPLRLLIVAMWRYCCTLENIIEFMNVSLWVLGELMSGRWITSMENGDTNLFILDFTVAVVNGWQPGAPYSVNFKANLEGDDGIAQLRAGLVEPAEADFARICGVTIKLIRRPDPLSSSFCGVLQSQFERINVVDPLKYLATFGMVEGQWMTTTDKKKDMLTFSKAFSLALQFNGCPVVSSFARAGLRDLTHIDQRWVRNMVKSSSRFDSYKREQLLAILRRSMPAEVFPGPATRQIVEERFGVSVTVQRLIEEEFKNVRDVRMYSLPLILDIVHPDWRENFVRYYTTLPFASDPSPPFAALMRSILPDNAVLRMIRNGKVEYAALRPGEAPGLREGGPHPNPGPPMDPPTSPSIPSSPEEGWTQGLFDVSYRPVEQFHSHIHPNPFRRFDTIEPSASCLNCTIHDQHRRSIREANLSEYAHGLTERLDAYGHVHGQPHIFGGRENGVWYRPGGPGDWISPYGPVHVFADLVQTHYATYRVLICRPERAMSRNAGRVTSLSRLERRMSTMTLSSRMVIYVIDPMLPHRRDAPAFLVPQRRLFFGVLYPDGKWSLRCRQVDCEWCHGRVEHPVDYSHTPVGAVT